MIRRRSTISIYDYPEHLNPFREERRESIGNKFRSFGQRGSSFRNAWNLLLPRSKRSQSFSRETTSPPPRPEYDTWTVRRTPRSQQEVFAVPTTWTISPRRRYTPPNSVAGSPPRSPANDRGSQLSVATLAVDVPSSDERLQWHGARPKKKKAPLPPMSPSGSSATSSSTTSLRDSRQPEDIKDDERESLQVLVSRIQQEFGEDPESSRRDQDDDQERKEPSDPAASRVEETSLQVEKPFVVESRVHPAPDDAAEEGSSATIGDGTSDKTAHVCSEDTTKQEDTTEPVDHSEDARESEVTPHEPQVPTKVFVETTSRTISSNGGTIITTLDDVETSSPTEPEDGAETKGKQESVTKPAENQADPSVQDQNVRSNDLNGAKSEGGSSVASEDMKLSTCESSTSECPVETVSGRYESGAFVVSTPDTASVYEDAASEEDFGDRDVKTLNGGHKTTPQETTTLDSPKMTVDVSNRVPNQVENYTFHTRTSLAVSSVDAKPSGTITSQNIEPKTHSIVTSRNMTSGSTTGGRTSGSETRNTDTSDGRVSTERTFSNSLKHQTSFSVTAGHNSAATATHKNDKGGKEATSGNRAPVTPRQDITSRTNGDINRTPVTAPRIKPSNGLPQQTSSAATVASADGSSAATPTPPPRNKPQPVPRMKRLRKLFSNQ